MMASKCGKVDKVELKYTDKIGLIWGIPIFGRGYKQVLVLLESWLREKKRRIWVATVNPEFVMVAKKDKKFLELLQKKTSLNVVDGVGLLWAMKIQDSKQKLREGVKVAGEILGGKHNSEIAAGSDLIDGLCRVAARRNWSVFFLGGWEDRARRTADKLLIKYPGLKVKGTYGGMANGEDEKILEVLGKDHIDILFVAYGMKRQEDWIGRNINKLDVGLVMGVGRSFDYYSGDLKRAPGWVRKMGMEWLYSLVKEPKRWRRQLVLPKFVWEVIRG